MSEGRRALLTRLAAIESGAECERWLPLLSAFADGEADARSLVELRPHLRTCTACRATLRELHDAARGLRSIVPPEVLLPAVAASGSGTGLAHHVEALLHGALERITAPALRLQGAVEALPAGKVAAVAASTVAVAGGGAAIERATTEPAASRPSARVERAAASAAPAAQPPLPLVLRTASASTPSVLVPASTLPAGPEWPTAGTGRAAAHSLLDEFGFEGPFPRSPGAAATGEATTSAGTSVSGAAGTSATTSASRRAGGDSGDPAVGRAGAGSGASGGGRTGAGSGTSAAGQAAAGSRSSATDAGKPNEARGSDSTGRAAEPDASDTAAAPRPSPPPSAPRSEPEFPASEF